MQQEWVGRIIRGTVAAGVALLTGCEGDGGGDNGDTLSDAPPAQVAGTWQGVFSYNVPEVHKSGSEHVTLSISQNGNELSGEMDGYSFSGTVNGNSLSFSAPTYDLEGLKVKLTASATYDGSAIVDVNGKAKAKTVGITVAEGTLHSDRLERD